MTENTDTDGRQETEAYRCSACNQLHDGDHACPESPSRWDSMEWERTDLGMDWEEYILYILEVDRDEVNKDCLGHLAEVLDRGV